MNEMKKVGFLGIFFVLPFFVFLLAGCGYRAEFTQKDTCRLAPGTKVVLTEIVNPSLRPELNILFRSQLFDELGRQTGIVWTQREQADLEAHLVIQKFDDGADLKGKDDVTKRSAVSLTVELSFYSVADASLFWSSGPVAVNETYYTSKAEALRRAVRLGCRYLVFRLFDTF